MSEAGAGGGVSERLRRLVTLTGAGALRGTLYVSPKPMVFVLRRQFSAGADVLAARSDARRTERRGRDHRRALRRAPRCAARRVHAGGRGAGGERLPTVVWTHGGAFVGGSKEEIGGYLRTIAGAGFTVVGVRYTLAPEAPSDTDPPAPRGTASSRSERGPTARRPATLRPRRRLGRRADQRSGRQCRHQPGVLERFWASSAFDQGRRSCVASRCAAACSISRWSSPRHRSACSSTRWAGRTPGSRDFRNDQAFISTVSVPPHVTAEFPPTFLTVGNTDPLAANRSRSPRCSGQRRWTSRPCSIPPTTHRASTTSTSSISTSTTPRTALDRMIAFFRRVTPS